MDNFNYDAASFIFCYRQYITKQQSVKHLKTLRFQFNIIK